MWTRSGDSTPKKAKTVLSAAKVMATIFWDSHCIILIWRKKSAFPPRQCTSSHECHCNGQIFNLRYEMLPHPLYYPDLALSDYFLFSNMKTWLGDRRFSSNEEIIVATNEYFERLDENYFLEGIKKLEYRYNKCIQLKGDYAKK